MDTTDQFTEKQIRFFIALGFAFFMGFTLFSFRSAESMVSHWPQKAVPIAQAEVLGVSTDLAAKVSLDLVQESESVYSVQLTSSITSRLDNIALRITADGPIVAKRITCGERVFCNKMNQLRNDIDLNMIVRPGNNVFKADEPVTIMHLQLEVEPTDMRIDMGSVKIGSASEVEVVVPR